MTRNARAVSGQDSHAHLQHGTRASYMKRACAHLQCHTNDSDNVFYKNSIATQHTPPRFRIARQASTPTTSPPHSKNKTFRICLRVV